MDLINSLSSADLLFIATVSHTEGKLIKKETDPPPYLSGSLSFSISGLPSSLNLPPLQTNSSLSLNKSVCMQRTLVEASHKHRLRYMRRQTPMTPCQLHSPPVTPFCHQFPLSNRERHV